ncbi:pre-mRNA-splicing factor CWC22-like protein [Thalictrum thalictroides]|uniref:Pre-mRNA-splicing factor CWC22-like protein n=1 Tax=Thalictrum thalictroides TaxID=46969 RepID=A0A7J6XF20_THATH|nr:pre-mRNA-splicing factor CWC22-like protein [Thalictrum thalictroides]
MSKENTTTGKAKDMPKLVILDRGLKLAESWMNNMSGSATDEVNEVEYEGRPPRLGLGAKAVHPSRVGPLTDPVERRLVAKLNAGKRRTARTIEETNPSESNVGDDNDGSDDDLESRTKAFTKKRATSTAPSLQGKKNKK